MPKDATFFINYMLPKGDSDDPGNGSGGNGQPSGGPPGEDSDGSEHLVARPEISKTKRSIAELEQAEENGEKLSKEETKKLSNAKYRKKIKQEAKDLPRRSIAQLREADENGENLSRLEKMRLNDAKYKEKINN